MYKSIVLGLCLIVALVLAHEGKSHHCIHDELEVNEGRSAMEFEFMKNPSSKERAIQQSGPPPHDYMRTKLEAVLDADPNTCYRAGDVVQTRGGQSYTCTQNDIMSTNKRQYVIDIANEALAILSSTLKVVRLASLQIPASSCGSSPGVTVPDTYKNGGAPGTDFVLFLTARPIPSTSSTSQVLAYASSCWATLFGRSIAGHANFNPSALDLNPASRRRQVAVALHEITHALGFSSGKFSNFIRWINATDYQNIDIAEVYVQTTLPGWKSASFIKSPNVLAFVRNHFGCNSLPGAEIEDGGGGGTAGSHWEKRTFNNEYMTGSEVEWSVFSPLTLAYFLDSGWYQVDDTKAQALVWGINQGCNFAMKQCLTGNWPTGDGYLCAKSTTGASVPTFDRVGYGICNYVTYSSALPAEFQNIQGKPADGGASQLADYCTYIQYNSLCTNQPSDTSVLNTAEQFCDTCRVFQGNLGSVTNTNSCYNVTCAADDDLRVQVESIWYKCPIDGGAVQPYNFEGSIDCEPKAASILCPQVALQPADLWPVYESIEPTSGGPGMNVTIKGSNLSKVTAIKIGPGISTTVTVISDTEIQAVTPDASNYGSLVFLTGSKVIVGVIDDQGRSDYKLEEFDFKTELNDGFIDAFGKWIEANPVWFAVIIVGAVGVIGCVIFCICRCCKKKKKGKPKRGQYHEKGGNLDRYYNEDYVRAQAASRA